MVIFGNPEEYTAFADLAKPVSLCNMGIISQFYRTIEKLRLEGTSGDHRVQAPAPSSNSWNKLPRTMSRCGLNNFTNSNATTSLGNPFPLLESEKLSSYI